MLKENYMISLIIMGRWIMSLKCTKGHPIYNALSGGIFSVLAVFELLLECSIIIMVLTK